VESVLEPELVEPVEGRAPLVVGAGVVLVGGLVRGGDVCVLAARVSALAFLLCDFFVGAFAWAASPRGRVWPPF
jgi:hypothetical protein